MYKTMSKAFAVIIATAALAACGGGGRSDSSGSGSGAGGGGGGGTTPAPAVTMTLNAGLTSLSAGGSTSLNAVLTDDLGNPYVQEVDVSFSSPCIGTNQATVNSPVTTATGTANTTYTAQGCTGNDTVTASTVIDGSTVSASVTINVAAATLGSIEFVSASPTNIALKGMGGAGQSEASTVTFRVRDTASAPIANQSVTFTLNTSVGGLQFSPGSNTATSGSDGLVQTIVQSGTVATPVRVTATVDATGISSQSDQLVVTTGIPDNNSFSLSAATLNPEAWNVDGVQVAITARLADRFNNLVPDGTTVVFTTEGGAIGGSCQTISGACSVNWTSQNPRPSTDSLNGTTGNAGRVTIRATAVGEESFTDQNGNGTYDVGEPFDDLPEAFLDENEDGIYQLSEPFADFNSDGTYNTPDGAYNGVVCNSSSCTVSTLNVRDSVTLVMSGSSASITMPATLTAPTSFTVDVVDVNGQVMPAGTVVSVTTDNGKISGPGSFTIPSTATNCNLNPGASSCRFTFSVAADTTPSSGILTLSVLTPGGLNTISTATVND